MYLGNNPSKFLSLLYQDPSSLLIQNSFDYSHLVMGSRAVVINTHLLEPFTLESPQIDSLHNVDDQGITRNHTKQVGVEHWVRRRHL